MSISKTCLLISDDPDDHQIIFEALKEISPDLTLIIAMDGPRVLDLVDKRKILTDYIIFDLEMEGMDRDLISRIKQHSLHISAIAYSEGKHNTVGSTPVFTKQMSFREVRDRLNRVINSSGPEI